MSTHSNKFRHVGLGQGESGSLIHPVIVPAPQFTIIEIAADDLPDPAWLASWQLRWPEWLTIRLPEGAPAPAWARAIDRALAVSGPAILLGRGVGCVQIAAWSNRSFSTNTSVAAAMLVAPEAGPADDAILPFPSVLVLDQAAPAGALAARWHSRVVDGAVIGTAGLGVTDPDWGHGRHIMTWLIEQAELAVRVATSRPRSCRLF